MREPSTSVAFTPYEISLCLYDIDRTRLWKQAIEDVVREGDVVVDAGSGTGILAVFAARDEARHVYALELHPRFRRLIRNLAAHNGVADRVTVLGGDASRLELPGPVDVIVCELLCTGQFFEPQVAVLNHLRQYLRPGGRVIPQRVVHSVQLLDAQETLYGLRVDTDSRSLLLADDEPVSTREAYAVMDFSGPVEPTVDARVRVTARKDARADAVVITSQAQLTDRLFTEPTRFLFNPEVLFLRRPISLRRGCTYEVHISYAYGGDTLDAAIEVEELG